MNKEQLAAMSDEKLLNLIVFLGYTAHIGELSEHLDRQAIVDDLERAKEEVVRRMK